jgi:hypothetical protein
MSTLDATVGLTGSLEAALDLMGGLVLESGDRWGSVAWPFQLEDARAILDPACASPYHFITRARGASKTDDLAAMAICVMLTQLEPGSRSYALAADLEQGSLIVHSIAGFAARTPELAGALTIDSYRVRANRAALLLVDDHLALVAKKELEVEEHQGGFAKLAAEVRRLADRPAPRIEVKPPDVVVNVPEQPPQRVEIDYSKLPAPQVVVTQAPMPRREVRVEIDDDGTKRYVAYNLPDDEEG